MKDLGKFMVSDTSSVFDTIKYITEQGTQFAVIVDSNKKLRGVVTDGDIRLGILKNVNLQSSVVEIMNTSPKLGKIHETPEHHGKMLKKFKIKHLPIVDENNTFINIFTEDEAFNKGLRKNPVVLMAGGLGSRLGDLTTNMPKPLLKVGEKPILEIILENFIDHGFEDFYFSVNFMSEMIEKHFGDGSDWGVNITYLKETTKLGTAGGLSLAELKNDEPLIIMNGDLLTKINFTQLLDFHETSKSDATMCVRKYDLQVPYGVIETDGNKITQIQEKPIHSFFVNAGIYVLNSKMLQYIEKNQYMDMPSLFEKARVDAKKLKVFPVHEYWLDIGRIEDFEQAQTDIYKLFK
jgi:dTDP-glucose pyrophosphorylase